MHLPKLHFITQPLEQYSNKELVEEVCKGGVRLVQLRIKDQSLDYIFEQAKQVKEICLKYNATFILNDYVSVAKELKLDGVHLGKSDLSPIEAREILGSNVIIGGTANDLNDIQNLIKAKVNYIGLGPYQFTTTKKQLSPVLGIKGYESILSDLENSDSPPIYAIGGIIEKDITPLLETGVYGIALSGLIANSNDIQSKTKIIDKILQCSI